MEFVSFKIAKKLKEKGFREECFARYYCSDKIYFERNSYHPNTESDFYCYNNDEDLSRFYIDAPTISQVLKWLRKEKHLHVEIKVGDAWAYDIYKTSSSGVFVAGIEGSLYVYTSYELAALAGIEYILDNLI